MAKYPTPGRVKTRLAAAIGESAACALHTAFVLDLADRLRSLPYAVTWAYWPPAAPFQTLVPLDRCVPQQGADLGARMEGAVAALLGRDPSPVAILGADAPHVPAASLGEAAAALDRGVDLVIGPATDGGYYLIGLPRPTPALFRDMAWGTSEVYETTVTRARVLGLVIHELAPTFDVDGPADLPRLQALLDGVVVLPRTAAVLAELGRERVNRTP